MKTMKTKAIFAIIMLIAVFASGQKQNVDDVEVTAPQFTGVPNAALIQNEFPNTLIKNFLMENIIYPEEAAYCYLEGTEVVEFTVTTEGNLQDFKIINSVCPKIDQEVILVLSQTNGMWVPGIKNGVPANMSMEIPFTFCASKSDVKSINEIFNEKAQAYFSKGCQTLFVKGNSKKALKYYDHGMTYLPYDKSLLLLRGLCRFDQGDKQGAAKDWSRLRELGGPDMSEFAELIKDMNGYEEMLAILKK